MENTLDLAALAAKITGVAFDSRKVRPGFAFVAIAGAKDDGAKYIGEALSRGASALVVADGVALPDLPGSEAGRIEIIRVPSPGPVLSELACEFYGNPSRKLAVYAVTGTNGKTTTAGLVRDILDSTGRTCGLLSTVEYSWPGHCEEASRTTPDPVLAQSALAAMAGAGCTAASIEASSHALHQGRISGVRLAAAAFTNLSQDHFDYHSGFEDYFACKRKLFEQLGRENPGAPAVINRDDPYGRRLLADAASLGVNPVSYSLGDEGDIRASGIVLGAVSTAFTLHAFGESAHLEAGLVGRYNVSNMLCAAGMALATGVPFGTVVEALSRAKPRWGRLERVLVGDGRDDRRAKVFVDYAHSPDAIEKALAALREVTAARLSIVFGCGGDRDRAKRPLMAGVAARLADRVYLTSDNPRTEDPEAILDEVETGIRGTATPYVRLADRREALARAILESGPGDVILVAGKGHETYQEVNGVHHHFDDRETVRQLLGAC